MGHDTSVENAVERLRSALQDFHPQLRSLYSPALLTVYGEALDQAGRIPSFLTFLLLSFLNMHVELRCRAPDDIWGWPSTEAVPRLQHDTLGFALRNDVAAPLPRMVWAFAACGCYVACVGQPPHCQLTRLDAWLRPPAAGRVAEGKLEAADQPPDPLPDPIQEAVDAADAGAIPAAHPPPEDLDGDDPSVAHPLSNDEDDDGSDSLLRNDDRAADPGPAPPPPMPALSDRVEGRQGLPLREYDAQYFVEGRGGLPEPLLPSAYAPMHALHLQRSSKDCLDAANGLAFITNFDVDTVALLTTFQRLAAADTDMTLSLLTAKNLGGRISTRSRMLHPETRRPLHSLPNLRIATLCLDSQLRAMDVFLVFPEGAQNPHRVWQSVWPQALAEVGGPPKLATLSQIDRSALTTFSQQAVGGAQLRKVRRLSLRFASVFWFCLVLF